MSRNRSKRVLECGNSVQPLETERRSLSSASCDGSNVYHIITRRNVASRAHIRLFTWWPHARPVKSKPNTKNGCALAWYLTSFLMGSGKKNLNCA